jgi:hypothetical protein
VSIPPVIFREPDEGDVSTSERVIYDAFIEALEQPSRTSPERAILRASGRCGVTRRRVLEVIRKINPTQEVLP